jgi:hypothetical protein
MARLFSCQQITTNRRTALIDKTVAYIDWLNARPSPPNPRLKLRF